MALSGRSIVSLRDFTKEDIHSILQEASKFDRPHRQDILKGKVMAVLFYEPSTRTRLSFEAAMHQLGGRVIGFSSREVSSAAKGESLSDTVRVIERYADVLVIRHSLEGAARLASEISKVPVINAGDGSNQHPTQTFLDIYTIMKRKGTLDNLKIGIMGDLKYSRTVHSLVYALAHFRTEIHLISPSLLKMPVYVTDDIKNRFKLNLTERDNILPLIRDLDVLYVTRIQKERFPDPVEYEKVRGSYQITRAMLQDVKRDLIIMHPLPRIDEIAYDVDDTEHAFYFEQLSSGIPVRKALLCMVLGVKHR